MTDQLHFENGIVPFTHPYALARVVKYQTKTLKATGFIPPASVTTYAVKVDSCQHGECLCELLNGEIMMVRQRYLEPISDQQYQHYKTLALDYNFAKDTQYNRGQLQSERRNPLIQYVGEWNTPTASNNGYISRKW